MAVAPAAPAADSFDAFLNRGLGPKAGLWPIPLPTQSYEHPSKPLSSERLLNLMVEAEPSTARSEVALLSTGGLNPNITAGSFGAGPIDTMNGDLPGFNYLLSGSTVYRQGAAVNVLSAALGALVYPAGEAAATLMTTIAVGVNAAIVCIPPLCWMCNHTDTGTGAMHPLGGTFPASGARWVAYLDGYFIFGSNDNVSQFFVSKVLDATLYNSLDYAVAERVPNVIRRGFIVNRELWLVGPPAIEVWYDSGDVSFPFAPQQGGVIFDGPRSIRSCAVGLDDAGRETFYWISNRGRVFRSVGYQAVAVSTPAIEAIIRDLGTAAISRALCWSQAGHTFYAVTIGVTTLVYDLTTKRWHNRSSSNGGTTAWLPSCAIQLGDTAIFGDSAVGNTYGINPRAGDDNGTVLLRQMTLPQLWSRGSRAFCNRVEIEMEAGGVYSPGDVYLSWSDDGGNTFNNPRVLNTGTLLELRKRVYTTRLGSYRSRVFRFVYYGYETIYAFDADLTQPMGGG